MAYVTGTANSFADLKTAFENACVANGWTLADGILYKGAVYIKFTSATAFLRMDCGTGKSGSTLTGANAHGVMMVSPTMNPITFPVNYEAHIFADPDEVYLVMNYNTEYYQHLNFGASNLPGIGNAGIWFTGSARHDMAYTDTNYGHKVFMGSSQSHCGTTPFTGFSCGLFAEQQQSSFPSSFIHCDLDGVSEWRVVSNTYAVRKIVPMGWAASLLWSLPNAFNGGNVLVPIKGVMFRNDRGMTIAVQNKNARYLRLDYLNSGDIITFGTDQWKVYPWHRRDSTQRDGVNWSTGATHSGTWGFAFRYTGA